MTVFATQNLERVKEALTSISCNGKRLCYLKKKENKIRHTNSNASLGCLTPVWCFVHVHLTKLFFVQLL